MRKLSFEEIQDAENVTISIGFGVFKLFVEDRILLEDREVEGEMAEMIDLFNQQQSIGAKKALKGLIEAFQTELTDQKSRLESIPS